MVRINLITVQDAIINNPEHIETILKKLGHEGIVDKGEYYSFKNIGGDNPVGCSVRKNNLVYHNYSHGGVGNIFTLVQDEMGCNFPKALENIARWIGIKEDKNIKIIKPFGGFYSKIPRDNIYDDTILKTYFESDLPDADSLSKLWLDDGVSLQTQEELGIRLDHESNRIIIPERNSIGQLVGAKARLNKRDCDKSERWSMYIPFSKSAILYGMYENYNYIQKKQVVFIFEAEKSVAQLKTWGYDFGVSVGGHSISKAQEKLIKSLMTKKIYVCFDEGICLEETIYEAKKLILNSSIINNKVGVLDVNAALPKNENGSPTDYGEETFKQLVKSHTIWIN